HLDTGCVDDPNSPTGCTSDPNQLDQIRKNVMRLTFDPLARGEYAGVNIEEPQNWGVTGAGQGYDLRGATDLVFDVRCPTPGGFNVQFGVGQHQAPFVHLPQSATYTTMRIPLASLGLSPSDLADVHVL